MTTTTFHHPYSKPLITTQKCPRKSATFKLTQLTIQPTWPELIELRLTERPNTVPEQPSWVQLVNTEVTSNVTVSDGTIHHVQGNQLETDQPLSQLPIPKDRGENSCTTAASFNNSASTHKQTRRLRRWEMMHCVWQQIRLTGESACFRICKQTENAPSIQREKENNTRKSWRPMRMHRG